MLLPLILNPLSRLRFTPRALITALLAPLLYFLPVETVSCAFAETPPLSILDLRSQIENKQFTKIEETFSKIQKEKIRTRAGGPLDVALLQKVFEKEQQENLTLKHLLDEWIKQSPKSELPYLFRSQLVYVIAWRVRGHFPPSQTNEEQLKKFERLIGHSYKDAETALTINPDSTLAIYRMLQVLRATGSDRKRFGQLFEHGTSLDRDNLALYLEMLLILNPAWGGDAEKMFHYAKTTAAEASPEGPVSWVLVEAHMDRARFDPMESYLREDDVWGEIETAAKPVIQNYPDTAHYTRALARMAWSSGRITRAKELMEESARREPENWALWYDLAKFFEQQLEDRDAAIDYLGKAITYSPSRVELYQERALLLSQGEDWALAAKDFEKLTELAPSNARAHYMLGRSLLALKQYQKALKSLNKSLELLGKDSNKYALTARCEAHLMLKQYDKATGDCAAALALDRTFEKALILQKKVQEANPQKSS